MYMTLSFASKLRFHNADVKRPDDDYRRALQSDYIRFDFSLLVASFMPAERDLG